MHTHPAFRASVVATLRKPKRRGARHPPRVLLLTSGLGTGHSRAAAAIEIALKSQASDCRTQTIDFWSMLDTGVATAIQQSYLRLVTQRPELYQRLYELDQHSWRDILEHRQALPSVLHELYSLMTPPAELKADGQERHWLDRVLYRQLVAMLSGSGSADTRLQELWQQAAIHRSWMLLAKRLQRHVDRFAPDIVVSTQVNMAGLAAYMKLQRQLVKPLIGVITDYGVHDFWVHDPVDLYCVADGSMTRRLCRGSQDKARVDVTGIPLMPDFSRPLPGREARQQLQVDANRPIALVLGGGLGIGIDAVVPRLAKALLGHATRPLLIVLAGRNQHLRNDLESNPHFRDALVRQQIRIHGWTDRMATYLRAADLVIGKPGGLTTAEVLACGRPLFSTHSLRGQESFNVAYLENHGVGQLLGEDQLVNRILELLNNEDSLRRMQARAWSLGKREGAEQIAARVLALMSDRAGSGLVGFNAEQSE